MHTTYAAAALAALLVGNPAFGQAYPSKPVLIISGTVQGNSGDTVLRLASARMAESMGQPFVVDTRPGASGMIATAAVARASADGYTLLFGTPTILSAKYMFKQQTFDVVKDFAPISMLVEVPSLLVVNSQVPARTLKEFIDHARGNPGKLAYGSTGLGSAFHLLGESLKQVAGIDILHIPYNTGGLAAMTTDLSTGRMQLYFPSYTTVRPLLAGGTVRVLAAIDRARVKTLPDVPILNEALPAFYNWVPWFGVLAPARTPRPIVDRLAAEIRKGLLDPAVVSKMDGLALTSAANTPEQFAARIGADNEYLSKIFPSLGIQRE